MNRPRAVSRRFLLGSFALAPGAVILAVSGAARAQGICVTPTDDGLPEALHFVETSPHPDRACRNCTFWTAAAGGGCGTCAMLQRSTSPNAFCESWAVR